MNHAKEYLDTMELLAPRLRDVQKFSVWKFDALCDWFAYHWNRGTISFSIKDGEAKGVCVIKLFSRLEQFLEPFVHEPCGQFCMVEALSADDVATMRFLHDELVDRWGPRQIMLWDRGERTECGSPKIFRWSDFERLTRRICKNGWRKTAAST